MATETRAAGPAPETQGSCVRMSVQFAGSMALLVLSAVAYFIALASSNWSASGQKLKMGIWDFCVHQGRNTSWSCYPVNADFSVAVQAFSILAAMCYACAFVLYVLYLIFHVLQRSRPLAIGMCLLVFCIVSLQIMSEVVYSVKNGDFYRSMEQEYFPDTLTTSLFISWSFAFAVVATLLATVSGILLYVEFKKLTYDAVLGDDTETPT